MRPPARNRGFVLVIMMASTVMLLSLVGLAIDTGRLHLVKSRMQTAADAASLGAVQARKADGAADVTAVARSNATWNGFTHGQNAVTVTVNNPPATGYYTGDANAVEVVIHQSVDTMFMVVAGFRTMEVTARSVSRRGASPNCVYALDSSASNAVSASGGATVQVSCGVVVDSSSNTAVNVSGGARITASSVSVVGNYSVSGGGVLSPTPVIHASPEADPFAAMAAPSVGACTGSPNYSLSGGAVATIGPGVYCGGISVSGGARLSLNPGTYILKGGGLSVSGGAYLTGSGVQFYNTYGGGYGYGAVSLSGGTTIQLSAPTTGALAGILFFQDRSVSSGAASTVSGGASCRFDGALYFPTTALSFSGGTGSAYTIVVAKTLSFSGGTTLNNDYSSLPGGTPVKGAAALGE
jgi:hypothetical protein